MFFPRVDPQTADALDAPAAAGPRIGRASGRTRGAGGWACAAVAVSATAVLVVLGLAAPAFWIAALFTGSLAIACIGSTAALLRADRDRVDPGPLADSDVASLKGMRDLHTALITGISRSQGRRPAAELDLLLSRIEQRWAALSAACGAARFEEGRQRADYPWTDEQRARIAELTAQRESLTDRADELMAVSRALPGRIAVLAGDSEGGIDPAALRLAMIEAQLRVDDIVAEPAL